MDFRIHRYSQGEIRLAKDPSALSELLHGKKLSSNDSKTKADLEKDYLGTQVFLTAYESATFDGVPRNLPEDYLLWQEMDYYLQNELIVVAQKN
ncbi:MAG: hypothetical protein KDB61_15955 [Planctomycetes bacterium]|nr:hypothetical protein [Planctomycetota bacterium]